jgi:hypothetical protein
MNDMSPPNHSTGATPIQADAMLSATLEAQEWNIVFSALQEMPMRISRPVFDRLMAQFQTATARS